MQPIVLPSKQDQPSRILRVASVVARSIGAVFLLLVAVGMVRLWLEERDLDRNAVAIPGRVVAAVYREPTCPDCSHHADLEIRATTEGGVVATRFQDVVVARIQWIEPGETLWVLWDPRTPQDLVLKTRRYGIANLVGAAGAALFGAALAWTLVPRRRRRRPRARTPLVGDHDPMPSQVRRRPRDPRATPWT